MLKSQGSTDNASEKSIVAEVCRWLGVLVCCIGSDEEGRSVLAGCGGCSGGRSCCQRAIVAAGSSL